MAGRQINDQSSDLALAHGGQLCGDDLQMPIHRELGLRVEIVEAARSKGTEILAQQSFVLGGGQVLDDHLCGFEKRVFSCSITFSSASPNERSSVCGSVRRSISCRMSTRSLRARQ